MSDYDGRIGAASTTRCDSDPLRTTCTGRSGAKIIFGNTSCKLHGAVLDLTRGEEDLRIVLVDKAGEAVLTLGPFAEDDVIATWRGVVASSGLTPMMRAWNGYTEPLANQIGKLRLGRAQDRKRLAVLARRRPRFLVRRKSTRLPKLPLVFREPVLANGREG